MDLSRSVHDGKLEPKEAPRFQRLCKHKQTLGFSQQIFSEENFRNALPQSE
jgi:hypothetical protein